MAPFKRPQRRRRSSETAASRNVRSRTNSRSASSQPSRSAPRYSTASSQAFAPSRQSQSARPSSSRGPGALSTRSVSAATSRTFGGDEQDAIGQGPHSVEPDMETLQEVVMAVNLTDRNSIGCAYYVARDEKLYFMEDVRLGGPDIIDACESRSSPDTLLVLKHTQ